MEGFWYYANEDKSVGPLTFAQLIGSLSHLREPSRILVWHANFDNWREARDVPEILAVMPDLADLRPPQAELHVQPRTEYRAERSTSIAKARQGGWRKVAGTMLTIVVFAVSSGVVRNLMHSATGRAKPDLASPISGAGKEAFIKSGRESCLKKQESDPDNKALRLSRETLTSYCSCYMDALAGSITFGDLEHSPKDGGAIPPEMQAKIDKASSPCWESLQRRLLGVSER
jgi:hypothetical protein